MSRSENPVAGAEEPRRDVLYEEMAPLSVGGMGELTLVRDVRLERTVVLKAPRDPASTNLDRFWAEARITARLEHPGIVPVHVYGRREDGVPYYTMRQVQGPSFDQIIAELHAASTTGQATSAGAWTLRKVVEVLYKACQTVAYAHSKGVLHLDLKPANLMVGAYGEVLIVDWGLAIDLGDELEDWPIGAGTPGFMAPEQARGEELSRATDVYALGAVLYQVLTGRAPPMGDPPAEIAARLPLDPDLVAIALRALSPAPSDRYPDAASLASELAEWLAASARREAAQRELGRARELLRLARRRAFSLVTDPPGAEVWMYLFREHQRRLVLEEGRLLGHTPLVAVELPAGSYLAVLRAPGRVPVRYPLLVRRAEHWDGVRPGDLGPTPVYLPSADELGPDDVYVPTGWAILGDPEDRFGLPRRRVWVDGFVMRRHPVTDREYRAFLDDLVASGRGEEAERHAPKVGEGGALRRPDWPVTGVSWASALAWCAWERQRTGQGWRLPWELEWEKASRGADGRAYPWGEHDNPSWSRNRQAQLGTPAPAPVGEPAEDEGVYGHRGLAGNVREWCLDPFTEDGPRVTSDDLWVRPEPLPEPEPGIWRVTKGGCWSGPVNLGRAGFRLSAPEELRQSAIGFRVARAFPVAAPTRRRG